MTPPHLASTLDLLKRAFPDGIAKGEYLPLLACLYPFMADENLAEVISLFTGREVGAVLNDVYAAGAGVGVEFQAVHEVRARLMAAGMEAWSREE